MRIKNVPTDINVEVIYPLLLKCGYNISFDGNHSRNAYNDIIYQDENDEYAAQVLHVARNSLYNILPECMFHSVDRFSQFRGINRKEDFEDEYRKQEEEKSRALSFFFPFDLILFNIRTELRNIIQQITDKNTILSNLIADNLSQEQRNNRFIKKVLPYMPLCKVLRGNISLLTILLRNILRDESVNIKLRHNLNSEYYDKDPRYSFTIDSELCDCFVGNQYNDNSITYDVYYDGEDYMDETFFQFTDELEMFRQFLQDYFISIEETLCFIMNLKASHLILDDKDHYRYLNYNTTL